MKLNFKMHDLFFQVLQGGILKNLGYILYIAKNTIPYCAVKLLNIKFSH